MTRGAVLKTTVLEGFAPNPMELVPEGVVKYWNILKTYETEDILIERDGARGIIWKKDLDAGVRITEPNLAMPLGMKLKLEIVPDPGWWKRRREERNSL